MLEKLIEELGGILYGLYNLIPEVPKGRSIEEAITRIGKAYADGELELPDEVGRGTLHWKHGTFTLEVSDALTLEVYGTFRGDKGNLPFIALRKEGMDKKEE